MTSGNWEFVSILIPLCHCQSFGYIAWIVKENKFTLYASICMAASSDPPPWCLARWMTGWPATFHSSGAQDCIWRWDSIHVITTSPEKSTWHHHKIHCHWVEPGGRHGHWCHPCALYDCIGKYSLAWDPSNWGCRNATHPTCWPQVWQNHPSQKKRHQEEAVESRSLLRIEYLSSGCRMEGYLGEVSRGSE